MKMSEFRRGLKRRGVQFSEGARHTKLSYRGRHSTLPRHAAEISEGLRRAILKQLGITQPGR
ncbi:mRNA interferase [Stenotrophomonas sp. 278]|nr:mRNA interferase [Stenotrophomonas sp. 278]